MFHEILKVEIADTPSKQSQGLMFRKSLADDCGMLFKFNRPQKLKFWGVNTYIPLDIAFVDPFNKIVQISSIKPLSDKTVSSHKDCAMAIEANYNYFLDKKINVGDKVQIDGSVIKFKKNSKLAQSFIDKEQIENGQLEGAQSLDSLPPEIRNMLEDYNDYEPGTVTDILQKEGPGAGSYLEDHLETEPHISPDSPMGQEESPNYLEPYPDVPLSDESNYPDFMNIEQAMQWANNNNESVRIWYQTLNGRDVERSVEPQYIYRADTTHNTILVTYDKTVNDYRAFIMDNILYYSFEGDNYSNRREEDTAQSQYFGENERISPLNLET